MKNKISLFRYAIFPSSLLLSIIISYIFSLTQQDVASKQLLFFSLLFGSMPLCSQIIASFKRRKFGIDIIAITAIASSLLLHQYLVGIVILLMLSTGETLEYYAFQRARKEISELISKAPTQAHKKNGSDISDVPIDSINPGDILVIKPGETAPVDGIIIQGQSVFDESALTGESLPVEKRPGFRIMSGSINQSGVIEIRAEATSAQSKYEQIIRLVREAQENEAPFVRMADRYSFRFSLITLGFSLLAWALSGDPLRVLAVLVVATPCPLILATPIAFTSGISRAAKRGIIIKNGGALESLGNAKAFIFDKTGTLTLGMPKLNLIDGHSMPKEDILLIAASLEQLSAHIVAKSLTEYAKQQHLKLLVPESFSEEIGKGVQGIINGKKYFFGNIPFLESQGLNIPEDIILKHDALKNVGLIITYLADEQHILGDIHFSDSVRSEVKQLFRNILASGIKKVVMLTGDKKKVAEHIAAQTGVIEYRAECLPEDKIREVQKIKEKFSPAIMVGDGINDAPALVAADTGIALGFRGSTASSEAGDIVITVDNLERVGEALQIGQRVLTIAKQSIFIGIGLSVACMALASLGFIPPVVGALVQECIDVIAILNALRVHTTRFDQWS